ncbi:MAG TPA: metallophosphoesterase [Vicinamibacterales bacterium]
MLLAHLSDLHLTDRDDAAWLDRQLDRIVARGADHVALTGDLLDRWAPAVLARVLDSLDAHGLIDPLRLTILHGNHDLASSGGHPRRSADLWRLVLRSWDPPPLTVWRRRRFYEAIARRADGIAQQPPFFKQVNGARIAVLDTIPLLWRPARFERRSLLVQHGIGCVRSAQAEWLAGIPKATDPLVVLVHHYPLVTPAFGWAPPSRWRLPIDNVQVTMEIAQPGRDEFWKGAVTAGARLVLCGHVHRARLEWNHGVAVGLNGQSGAAWAGRTVAFYKLGEHPVRAEFDSEAIGR